MSIYLGNQVVQDIVFVPSIIVDNIVVAQTPIKVNKIAETNSIGEVVSYVDVALSTAIDTKIGYSHINIIKPNSYPYSNRIGYSHIDVIKANNY